MSKSKTERKNSIIVKAKNPKETANLLGFSDEEARLMEVRIKIRQKIKDEMKKQNITHESLAKKVGTSRARISRLANNSPEPVTIDFLIKVLSALGLKTELKFSKAR